MQMSLALSEPLKFRVGDRYITALMNPRAAFLSRGAVQKFNFIA